MSQNYPESSLTREVIGLAQTVHSDLGPGFLESIYQAAMCKELELRGLSFVPQAPLQVLYRGDVIGTFYADFLVENRLICELKAVKAITLEHESQLIHYLKATRVPLGLLLNFGAPRLEVKRRIFSENQRSSAANQRHQR